jgi:F-type H+-transporting ATPase subunit epsilon
MELMKLEIITPTGVIYDADIKQVTLPGKDGEFGVLPRHASLVSLLESGLIEIETKDSKLSVVIDSGYVKVSENRVICLVDGAVTLDNDDNDISQALEKAQQLMKSVENSNAAIATAKKLNNMKSSI